MKKRASPLFLILCEERSFSLKRSGKAGGGHFRAMAQDCSISMLCISVSSVHFVEQTILRVKTLQINKAGGLRASGAVCSVEEWRHLQSTVV